MTDFKRGNKHGQETFVSALGYITRSVVSFKNRHLNSCDSSVTLAVLNPASPIALALLCSDEDQRMTW